MDQSSQPDNSRLVRAMEAIATSDTPDARQELYIALLGAVLMVPTRDQPPPGITSMKAGDEFNFVMLQAPDGAQAWPFFTDRPSLQAWQADVNFYSFNAVDVFRLANHYGAQHIVLNPAGPVGGEIVQWEIVALAKGQIPASPDYLSARLHDTPVLIGAPEREPSARMAAHIQQTLTRFTEVGSAYLFTMIIGVQMPRLVLGVRFAAPLDPKRTDQLMTVMAGQVRGGLSAQEPISLFVITDDLITVIASKGTKVFDRS